MILLFIGYLIIACLLSAQWGSNGEKVWVSAIIGALWPLGLILSIIVVIALQIIWAQD